MKRLGTSGGQGSFITESTFLYLMIGLFLVAFLVSCESNSTTTNEQLSLDSTTTLAATVDTTVVEKKKLCVS